MAAKLNPESGRDHTPVDLHDKMFYKVLIQSVTKFDMPTTHTNAKLKGSKTCPTPNRENH